MKHKIDASYYAEALFDAAQKCGQEEEIGAKLAAALNIFTEYAKLQAILANQLITPQEREQALKALLPRVMSEKKEEIVTALAPAYQHLLDEAQNREPVAVRVAAPLSSAQELELKERLSRLIGKQVRLEITTDPTILGGLVLRWGDRVIDASILKKLELLGAHLKTAPHPVN